MLPSFAPNPPLLFALLLALGVYLIVTSWGHERPDLATWLRDRERRPRHTTTPRPVQRSLALGGPFGPLFTDLAHRLLRLAETFSIGQPARLAQRLELAGQGRIADHYANMVAWSVTAGVCGLGLVGLTTTLAAAGWRGVSPLPAWLPLGLALVGALAPNLELASRLRLHQARARAELPRLLDHLIIGLAANKGLQAGLDSAAGRGGVLAPALRDVLTAYNNGGAAIDAGLHHLAERLELAELHLIATTVGWGDRQGVTVRAALSRLAEDLRTAERHQLERAGQAATLRQLLPVGALVFPAFILTALVPAIDLFLVLQPR